MSDSENQEDQENPVAVWHGCKLNALKHKGKEVAFAYGVEILLFLNLPPLEVTHMQLHCQFYYAMGVPRAQSDTIRMRNAMRFYFTSPTDSKFEKSIIEYRCRTGICPDDWPAGRFEQDQKREILEQITNEEEEKAQKKS